MDLIHLKDDNIPPAVPPKEPISPTDLNPLPDATFRDGSREKPQSLLSFSEEMKTPKIYPGTIRVDDMRSYHDTAKGHVKSYAKESSFSKRKTRSSVQDRAETNDNQSNTPQSQLKVHESIEIWEDAVLQPRQDQHKGLSRTIENKEPTEELVLASSSEYPSSSGSDCTLDEDIMSLQQRINDLEMEHRALLAEKQKAENKVRRLDQKVTIMKEKMSSSMIDAECTNELLAAQVEKLHGENGILREELSDAMSHIFSLQPYRKDLTPKEVGREYDDLVEDVQDWVQKFMDPWLRDHPDGVERFLRNACERPLDARSFINALQKHPDLVHGSYFPETDEDVVSSMILRFLHDHIFQSVLYGSARLSDFVEKITFIEQSMLTSAQPKRDLFTVRNWTAEAYNAIIGVNEFENIRSETRYKLTRELGSMLRIFCSKEPTERWFDDMYKFCIEPAMKLYEKLAVSTNHFYLDLNPYISWEGPGDGGGRFISSPEFLDVVMNIDCRNVVQNRKAFNMTKIDPMPSKRDLFHRLENVCTVKPALYLRQIGQKDSMKEPTIVRKQQILVAWGPEDKRREFKRKGDRTLVSHLYENKSDRFIKGRVPGSRC